MRAIPRASLPIFLLAFAAAAQAQYTWTGGSTPGSWSNATNWAASNSPVSATNTQLEFSFSGGGTESTNNLGSFTLNQLTHTSTGTAGKTITGNTLVFASNGATGPSIIQSSTAGLTIANALSIGGVNLVLSNTTSTLATLSGAISGAGLLDVRGGVWLLSSSSSSFSGGLNLSGASTQLVLNTNSTGAPGAVTAGPAGTGKITLQGGVLRTANSSTITVNNDVDIDGNVQFGNSSPATSKLTLGGAVTLLGDTTRTVTLSGSNPVVLAGAVAGSGASSALTVVGTGTLEFSGTGANTYSGNTTLNSSAATLLLNKTGVNAVAGNLVVSNGSVLLGQAGQIADTAAITNTGGLIDLGGFTETVGSFRLAATTTAERLINGTLITSGGTGTNTVDNSVGILTISANLQGSNQLFKNGNGILHLSGSNTYTGGTLIRQASTSTNGTAYGVVLKADEALGSGSLRLEPEAGGTARLALNGYDQTVSALSSSATGLSVIEANGNEGGSVSTLTINQATDTVYSGILRDSNSTTSATLALVKTGSGLLDLSGVGAGTYSGGLSVNGGTVGFGSAVNALGNAGITLGGGALRYTATGGTNSTLANTIALSTATTSTLEVTDSSVGLTITNVVSGSGALNKTGNGVLTLSGANSYSGGTTINAGTVRMDNNAALGSGTVTMNDGASLSTATSAGRSLLNDLVIAGDVSFNQTSEGTGLLNLSGTSIDLGGVNRQLTINTLAIVTQADSLVSTAGFTKAGEGRLNISGSQNYSGSTILEAGTLSAGNDGSFGTSTLVLRGGTLASSSTAARTWNNAVSLEGNVVLTEAADLTGAVTLSGAVDLGSAARTLTVNTEATLSGVVDGSGGGLTKAGNGTLTLSGANTYTGATTVAGGTLRIDGNARLGNTTNTITLSNAGILEVTAAGALTNAITIGTGNGVLSNSSAGALVIAGAVSKDGTVFTSRAGSGTNVFTGVISGASANSDFIVDGGTTVFSNVMTYNGPTIITNGGTLVLGVDDAMPSGSDLILGGGTFLVDVVNYNADSSLSMGTLTLTEDSTIDLGGFGTSGDRNLVFADSSTVTWTTNAVLTITNWQGVANQTSAVTKLLFGTGGLDSTQLAQIRFADQNIDGGQLLGGDGELAPIPEAPVVWGAAALAAFIVWRERRRLTRYWRLPSHDPGEGKFQKISFDKKSVYRY
jgi:fibronectin-binding autotransporter adhesin